MRSGEWSDWHQQRLYIPRKVEGRWIWLRNVERRMMMYPNKFSLIGVDFHKEYRRIRDGGCTAARCVNGRLPPDVDHAASSNGDVICPTCGGVCRQITFDQPWPPGAARCVREGKAPQSPAASQGGGIG